MGDSWEGVMESGDVWIIESFLLHHLRLFCFGPSVDLTGRIGMAGFFGNGLVAGY